MVHECNNAIFEGEAILNNLMVIEGMVKNILNVTLRQG